MIFDNFLVIDQQNKGPGHCRNKGMELASGKFIFFMDSDDFLCDCETLRLLYDEMEKENLDICMAGMNFYHYKKNLNVPLIRKSGMHDKIITGRQLLKKDYDNLYSVNKLYKKKFLLENELNFPEGVVYEDCLFTPLCYYFAKRVKYINLFTYSYRKNHDSITSILEVPLKNILYITDELDNLFKITGITGFLHAELSLYERLLISNYHYVEKNISRRWLFEIKHRKIFSKFYSTRILHFWLVPVKYILRFYAIKKYFLLIRRKLILWKQAQ